MTLQEYAQALGYTYTPSEDGTKDKWTDANGENVSPQALQQLQDAYNQFNQTDAQGRPLYGTEAYKPGEMSGAYDQGLFRVGTDTAGPQLQPILDQMGASIQYDPRYGYVIPQAAQDQWSQQFGQPKGFDAFMENLASNAPIALGGAVLGGGLLGTGPFAGGSTLGGPAFDLPGYLSQTFGSGSNLFSGGGSGAGSGASGTAGAGGLSADTLNFLQSAGYTPQEISSLSGMFDASGSLIPSAAGGALQTAAPVVDKGTQAGFLDTVNNGGSLTSALGSAGSGLTSLLSNKGLAAALGAGLGYLSGANQPATLTSQTDIPDWLKPYYTKALDAGVSQLGQSGLNQTEQDSINAMLQRLNAPNAGLDAANQVLTDTASGKYLDLANNPQWQEAQRVLGRSYNDTTRPGTDSAFSRAGAFGVGNSAWEEMTKRNQEALSTGLGSAAANVWGTERQNQLNAAGAMPGFQQQYLTGLGNLSLGLGNYQRTQPWQGLLNYSQLLGSTRGPSTTSTTNPTNPWQSALGGALSGYALTNLWK